MRTAFFVTCLVDLFRPNVGFAAMRLLADAGLDPVVPAGQTCCGQPAYNSGDLPGARAMARRVIESFAGFDRVVVPSGSCAGMIARHYPELFRDEPEWLERSRDLAGRTRELTRFLAEEAPQCPVRSGYQGRAAYHDGCAGRREMGVARQPRELLRRVEHLELAELPGAETCCGFGGTFCVKYPAVSTRMADDKAAALASTGADTLLAGEMGCLLHITGRLRRLGRPLRVFHVAEVLAGMAEGRGLGARKGRR